MSMAIIPKVNHLAAELNEESHLRQTPDVARAVQTAFAYRNFFRKVCQTLHTLALEPLLTLALK
jgi:hypothetical protein